MNIYETLTATIGGIFPRAVLLLALAFAPLTLFAQGFAGLGQGSGDYDLPQEGVPLVFPDDHGAHPRYRIEWWYLTAILDGADGETYGVQWTLFRSALTADGPQVWMGHMGVTTPDDHHSGERLARGDVGVAGVTVEPFEAWIDDWSMESTTEAGDAFDALRVTAAQDGVGYDLRFDAQGPLVRHGEDGFSVKAASGQASYYYSQPFYAVEGTLALPEGEVAVTGQGWLDREWSSQLLRDTQEGWDWFSLHLDDGHRLMAFQVRDSAGAPFTYASWIEPDGTTTAHYGALELEPLGETTVAGRDVPTRWRLALPERGVDLTVEAVNGAAWQDTLFPYWEGPVTAEGSHDARGYLEMTGYE